MTDTANKLKSTSPTQVSKSIKIITSNRKIPKTMGISPSKHIEHQAWMREQRLGGRQHRSASVDDLHNPKYATHAVQLGRGGRERNRRVEDEQKKKIKHWHSNIDISSQPDEVCWYWFIYRFIYLRRDFSWHICWCCLDFMNSFFLLLGPDLLNIKLDVLIMTIHDVKLIILIRERIRRPILEAVTLLLSHVCTYYKLLNLGTSFREICLILSGSIWRCWLFRWSKKSSQFCEQRWVLSLLNIIIIIYKPWSTLGVTLIFRFGLFEQKQKTLLYCSCTKVLHKISTYRILFFAKNKKTHLLPSLLF